jgi:uncharacterized protein (DUF885 family)
MSEVAALADEYWEYVRHANQLRALWKGDVETVAEVEDLSIEGVADRRRRLIGFAEQAESLAPDDVSDRTTAETIAFTARGDAEWLDWQADITMVNHAIGLYSLLATFLPRYPLVTAEHGDDYLVKLERIDGMLAGLESRLGHNVEKGITPIETAVRGVIDQIDRHLQNPASGDPFLAQPPPTELGEAETSVWRDGLADRVEHIVRPALARLRTTLAESVLAAARPDDRPGICHFDGGAEAYGRLVWAHTGVDLTARQVHEIGLAQVARLEEEYREVGGRALGIEDVGEIFHRLRNDPDLHYRSTDDLIRDATRALVRAEAAAPDWFGLRPEAPCVASGVEQGPLAFYSAPAQDGSKPGNFFFNTADPSVWGTFQLEAVTYHESIPGHHFQIALAQELDLHPIHHRLYIAGFSEGWGLYTERLAEEMGLYSSDIDRLGMLSADSMRACRLVVDTGMHALGWTREQAIQYMLDNSPNSRGLVVGEIDRYLGDPGQALGYMIGRLEIEKIRAAAEARLGAAFDLPGFHDAVLGHGVIPLATLRRRVEAWSP